MQISPQMFPSQFALKRSNTQSIRFGSDLMPCDPSKECAPCASSGDSKSPVVPILALAVLLGVGGGMYMDSQKTQTQGQIVTRLSEAQTSALPGITSEFMALSSKNKAQVIFQYANKPGSDLSRITQPMLDSVTDTEIRTKLQEYIKAKSKPELSTLEQQGLNAMETELRTLLGEPQAEKSGTSFFSEGWGTAAVKVVIDGIIGLF